MKRWFKISFILTFAIILISGKNQEIESSSPEEPVEIKEEIEFSFLDLYYNVFETSCALSNCHDGNFEPNFTSPQATYYSTVFHGVKKNSASQSFTYRIMPYKPDESLLLERIINCCFINEDDSMPLLMGELDKAKIDSIKLWINSGAPDAFGEFPYLTISED